MRRRLASSLLAAGVAWSALAVVPVSASEEGRAAPKGDRVTTLSARKADAQGKADALGTVDVLRTGSIRDAIDLGEEAGSEAELDLEGSADMRGALEEALRTDAATQAARADLKVADREVLRELLRYAPVLSATLSTSDFSPTGSGTGTDSSTSFGAVEASWTVFDSGSRFFSTRSAQARRDAAAEGVRSERGRTALKLIDAWTDAIASAGEIRVARESVARLERLRNAVEDRRGRGFASAADVAQAEADIASARQQEIGSAAEFEKARDTLRRLTGRGISADARLPDLGRHLAGGKDGLYATALQRNPDLRAARLGGTSARYASKAALARHLPSVELNARYRVTYEDSASQGDDPDGVSLGVRVRVPIADPSQFADTSAQMARVEAAAWREAAARDDLEGRIDGLWSDWKAAKAMGDEADREAAQRRKAADAAEERFRNGFGTLEEATRAASSLAGARRAALQLRARESQLAAQLLVVAGTFEAGMLP